MVTSAFAAALPSFLASLVEFVEALTIVLAVGATRGWRAANLGAAAGAVTLAIGILALGPALGRVPIATLQVAIGVLLLLFGMRWLRKAILRYAGVVPMHDEAAVFAKQHARFSAVAAAGPERYDWTAIATTFNAVVLEGLEVVFIVIAVGATAGALVPAGIGAAAAGAVVIFAGVALRAPLSRVPENGLKFFVGVMLAAFGTFWTGEGLGIAWPGDDAALAALIAGYLAAAGCGIALSRPAAAKASDARR